MRSKIFLTFLAYSRTPTYRSLINVYTKRAFHWRENKEFKKFKREENVSFLWPQDISSLLFFNAKHYDFGSFEDVSFLYYKSEKFYEYDEEMEFSFRKNRTKKIVK